MRLLQFLALTNSKSTSGGGWGGGVALKNNNYTSYQFQ